MLTRSEVKGKKIRQIKKITPPIPDNLTVPVVQCEVAGSECYLGSSPAGPVSLPAHGHQGCAPAGQPVDPAQVLDGGGEGAAELGQPQTSAQTVHLQALTVSPHHIPLLTWS